MHGVRVCLHISLWLSCALAFTQRGSNSPASRGHQHACSMKIQTPTLRQCMAAFVLATSFSFPNVEPASAAVSQLETSIINLEKAENRGDTLQGLADVFEAAGSKTLLARTKFKYRIINAINEKQVKLSSDWDPALNYASRELKRRADPLRTVDLSSFLSVAPYTGAVAYLGAIFVQQALPELFIFAYPLAALSIVAPVAYIILTT